jgi:TPR repeat protein
MNRQLCKLGLVLALATLASLAQARTDGEKAVAGVGERLRAKDCEGAIKALNSGLQAGYPEAALLAGTMFEAGFCVNKNWDKAVGFYTQAHDGGIREGALRLAAGFAAMDQGPDTAAALWWAKRAGLDADHCTASLPAADDPDRFVAALREWRPRSLEACNFVVGEMAFIAAEARYPMQGIEREIMGRSELVFTPARAHFKSEARDATRPAQHAMSDVLVRAISLAGARYRKPEGIPLDWTIPFVVVVDTDKNRWW